MIIRSIFAVAALSVATLSVAHAQEAETPAWTGEGSFGAGVTTGNTETTDVNAGLKLAHKGALWAQSGEFAAEYGKTDGDETKNKMKAAGQVDRFFGERLSAYGRLTWEKDEFSGFENRYFAGLGAAYKVVVSENTLWTLQGGPGYRIDEIRAQPTATPPVPASTEESLGVAAGSRFKHQFNAAVALTNDTDVVWADTSTQTTNSIALTAQLMGNLSARISFDVNHDANPPEGFEATDTATRFSLVYKLG
jgi:putative salt-induced outer membrane protein